MRNRISLIGLTVVLALVAAFGTKASAQYENVGGTGFSVRAGAFFPSERDARDLENDVWFTGGVEWNFYPLPVTTESGYTASLSLSADWAGSGDLYTIPVLVNYNGRVNQLFYSAGAGLAFNKKVQTRTGNNYTTDTETDFAWQVTVGYDFVQGPTPVFGAVRYNGTDDLNGFSVLVGVRF